MSPSALVDRVSRTALGALVVLALGIVVLAAIRPRELPVLSAVPAFQLTDQDGRPFDSGRLRGKVWVGAFIFTHCRDTCPAMAGHLVQLQDALKSEPRLARAARIVCFSVDPQRDDPKALSEFLAAHGADHEVWTFLTGDMEMITKLSNEGFRMPLGPGESPDPTNPPDLVHSQRFGLVDGAGRLRGYYSPIGEKGDLPRLVEDLKLLARESPPAP